MIVQAKGGGGNENAGTGGMIDEMSEVAADDFALMYGGEIESKFSDSFANNHIYPDGFWLLNKVDRDARSLNHRSD